LFFTSIGFYGLFYFFRESVRYFSITEDNEIWVLSEAAVNFYNNFYAFVAIILGISAAFNFLIDRPIGLKRERTLRTLILNDQRFLNWSFLGLATKMMVYLGIFFTSSYGYYDLKLYPEYNYIFILLAVVLYLQIWTNIIRYIKINKTKLFFFSSVVILIASMLLGSVNLIDYKKINSSVLIKNVYHTHELIKPKSDFWQRQPMRRSLSYDLFVAHEKNSQASEPVIFFGNTKIEDLKHLDKLITRWRNSVGQNSLPGLHVNLHINSKTEMHYVNKIKKQLVISGISKIGYGLIPSETGLSERIKKLSQVRSRIHNPDWFPIDNYKKDYSVVKVIDLDISNQACLVNNQSKTFDELAVTIESMIYTHPNYIFNLSYRASTSYEDFLKVYSTIFMVTTKLREEEALKNYQKNVDFLKREERQLVREKFPIIIEDQNYLSQFDGSSLPEHLR